MNFDYIMLVSYRLYEKSENFLYLTPRFHFIQQQQRNGEEDH